MWVRPNLTTAFLYSTVGSRVKFCQGAFWYSLVLFNKSARTLYQTFQVEVTVAFGGKPMRAGTSSGPV